MTHYKNFRVYVTDLPHRTRTYVTAKRAIRYAESLVVIYGLTPTIQHRGTGVMSRWSYLGGLNILSPTAVACSILWAALRSDVDTPAKFTLHRAIAHLGGVHYREDARTTSESATVLIQGPGYDTRIDEDALAGEPAPRPKLDPIVILREAQRLVQTSTATLLGERVNRARACNTLGNAMLHLHGNPRENWFALGLTEVIFAPDSPEPEPFEKRFIREFADLANRGGLRFSSDTGRALARELLSKHRTLQQAVMGAIKVLVDEYAVLCHESEYGHDERNRAAYEWARRTVAGPQENDRYIVDRGIGFPLI